MIGLILMILGLVCFIGAAAGVESRIGLTPLGLAFWIFALILGNPFLH